MRPAVTICLAYLACMTVVGTAWATETPSARMHWNTAGPVTLPKTQHGEVKTAAGATRWIVGAKPGSRIAATVKRYRARKAAGLTDTYLVGAGQARWFAKALLKRKKLLYAEPDTRFARASAGSIEPETYSLTSYQWAVPLLRSGLTPPSVSGKSPLLAVIDSQVDTAHPEFRSSALTSTGKAAPHDAHGTAVVSIAASPADGVGIEGLWPGMRVLAISSDLSCSDAASALQGAVRAGARVINMSYVQEERCFSHLLASQKAVRKGVVLIAAAGNEFGSGSPKLYPAADPHVLSVGAVAQNLQVADFSNANDDVDLVAPGLSVAAAVPQNFDGGGLIPGWDYMDGTSAAAPFVAASAAWVAQERPSLASDQISGLLLGAAAKRDLGRPGFDEDYGYGLLNIKAALTGRAPKRDFGEPNDDVNWVDGTLIRKKAKPILAPSRRRKTVKAYVRRGLDPADVYRVVLCPKQSVKVRLKARKGRGYLIALDRDADSIDSRRARLAKRTVTKKKRARLRIYWPGPRRRTIYIAVKPSGSKTGSGRLLRYHLDLTTKRRSC